MSYQVISRKWRPVTFQDVIGQEHITQTLQNAIEMDRLGHAYIFSGPRGTGKTTTARILAKMVNCQNPQGTNPCNSCSSCLEISESRNMDVLEIDGASNRGIEDIRNLREMIKYPPTKGKYRIYIIDEFHQITKDALNALLKTLEEPPPHALFIFATTELQKVLPTILSRCQRFEFRRIPTAQIVQNLRFICNEEKVDISDEALMLVAQRGDGSMRDSQSFLEQIISFTSEAISYDMVVDIMGIIKDDYYINLIETILKKDIEGILTLVDDILMKGYDLQEFMNGFSIYLRNLYLVKAGGSAKLVETTDFIKQKMLELSAQIDDAKLMQMLSMATQQTVNIGKSLNPRILTEAFLLKLTHLDSIQSVSKIIQKTGQTTPRPSNTINRPTPSPSPAPQQPIMNKPSVTNQVTEPVAKPFSRPAPKPFSRINNSTEKPQPVQAEKPQESMVPEVKNETRISLETVKEQWEGITQAIGKTKQALLGILPNVTLKSMENNTLQIAYSDEFALSMLKNNKSFIEKILAETFGTNIQLSIQKIQLTEDEKKNKKAREIDDKTQMVIQVFDGELI